MEDEMDRPTTVTVLELTDAELRLLRNALEVYESAFGHEEADLIAEIKAMRSRLDDVAEHGN